MRHIATASLLILPLFSYAADERSTAGRSLFWGSDCLTKVMRSAVAPTRSTDVVRLEGCRGEVVSGQAVYRPSHATEHAGVSITDLRHRVSGATIPAARVALQWERHIDITRNSENVPQDELIVKAPASIPDPFWPDTTIPLVAAQAAPIWIEVHVPVDIDAGDYEAQLIVTADGHITILPVMMHLWDFEMPTERHLSVINWWRFPGQGFAGREEDQDLLRRFCAFLVEHRQTDVNIGIDMIRDIPDTHGGFSHDTSLLERFAETVFSTGIRQIHLHSIGKRTAPILDPECEVIPVEANLRRLAAWEQVIRRRGWQRRFAASIIDEPFAYYEQSYTAVVDLIHRTAPNVRCVEAVEAEYLGGLDIYVPKLSHLAMWYPRFEQVQRDGAELWFYICNHPYGRYPNRWLDQPLLASRVLFWMAYRYHLDGYLHWGLNQYMGDAYTQEGISKNLPLGERAIVYPGRDGLIGSLRFSAQRDGVQDYEYLWVLENRLTQIKERVGADAYWLDPRQRPIELCGRVVQSFTEYARNPSVLLETRRAVAEEIEAVEHDPLLIVQTSPPEATAIPAGPRHITVRGLTTPGAHVSVNGQAVKKVRPSGYFCQVLLMPDDQPVVCVTAGYGGRTRSVTRTFRPTQYECPH